MSSVSERLAKYRAAAEEAARFGDSDAAPPARVWDVPPPSPKGSGASIASKALEYEKSVQILRADQDTPGVLEKLQSGGESILEVEEETTDNLLLPAVKSSQQNAILKRTKQYERSVEILRADQETPGIREKLLQSKKSELGTFSVGSSNNIDIDDDDIDNIEKRSSIEKGSITFMGDVKTSEQHFHEVEEENKPNQAELIDDVLNVTDEENIQAEQSRPQVKHSPPPPTPRLPRLSSTRTSESSSKYTHQTLSSGDPRLSVNSSTHNGSIPHRSYKNDGIVSSNPQDISFQSTGTGFTGDSLDAITEATSTTPSEGAIMMEELVGESEFTNDAVAIDEEETVSVGKYYEAKHQNNMLRMPSRAPTLESFHEQVEPVRSNLHEEVESSSSNDSEVSSVDFDMIRLPERESDRPSNVPTQRRPIRRVPRGDTGRPITDVPITLPPESLIHEESVASETEDEGVRQGWSRQHSDRLPKAKVVMIGRRRSDDGIRGEKNHGFIEHDTDDTDLTAPSTLLNRRLLAKQYKDRGEFIDGRVSRIDQTRTSRLASERRTNEQKQKERSMRYAAGVARRSSLVAHTIDRVSMAADPFIEFMDTRSGGTPGPRKPRGTLGKLWYRLFRRKGKRGREMLKSG